VEVHQRVPELLRDHLQINRPRFHKALELIEHVRDRQLLLDSWHKLLWPRFRDCDDEGHVHHLGGKTFHLVALGRHRFAANSSFQQLASVGEKLHSWQLLTIYRLGDDHIIAP
jgi:hypothetical protein